MAKHKQKESPRTRPRLRGNKSVSRRNVSNSRLLSTIRRIEGPFYSDAMKSWRIQYYEHGVTYDKGRESSLYCERVHDAEIIGKIFVKVSTWQEWQKAIAAAKKAFKTYRAEGYIYAVENGKYVTIADSGRASFPSP